VRVGAGELWGWRRPPMRCFRAKQEATGWFVPLGGAQREATLLPDPHDTGRACRTRWTDSRADEGPRRFPATATISRCASCPASAPWRCRTFGSPPSTRSTPTCCATGAALEGAGRWSGEPRPHRAQQAGPRRPARGPRSGGALLRDETSRVPVPNRHGEFDHSSRGGEKGDPDHAEHETESVV
jgi:hypothetical protein